MIATGGTIASKEGDLGLTPAVTGEELAASVPGIKDICHLEILQLMNIDSTNMRPRQWLMIRDAIMENYNNYDGFVVLHGTDTMAYTAAALSYLIQDSVKPIVPPVAIISMFFMISYLSIYIIYFLYFYKISCDWKACQEKTGILQSIFRWTLTLNIRWIFTGRRSLLRSIICG